MDRLKMSVIYFHFGTERKQASCKIEHLVKHVIERYFIGKNPLGDYLFCCMVLRVEVKW